MSKYEDLTVKFKELTYNKMRKEKDARKNLILLHDKLVEYLGSGNDDVTIKEPVFNSSRYISQIEINFHFKDVTSSKGIKHEDTFSIQIEGGYLNDQNIMFESNFYKFNDNDLNKFFNVLYQELEKRFT